MGVITNDIYDIFMNIYLHNRLKQYDPETKVETIISRKVITTPEFN